MFQDAVELVQGTLDKKYDCAAGPREVHGEAEQVEAGGHPQVHGPAGHASRLC